MRTHNITSCQRKMEKIPITLSDLALLSTLISSNYPCLEHILMVPTVRAIEVLLYFMLKFEISGNGGIIRPVYSYMYL